MTKRAKDFLAALNQNVDAWYEGQIDYEEFQAQQRAIWGAIHGAGQRVEKAVLRMLRHQTLKSGGADGTG